MVPSSIIINRTYMYMFVPLINAFGTADLYMYYSKLLRLLQSQDFLMCVQYTGNVPRGGASVQLWYKYTCNCTYPSLADGFYNCPWKYVYMHIQPSCGTCSTHCKTTIPLLHVHHANTDSKVCNSW